MDKGKDGTTNKMNHANNMNINQTSEATQLNSMTIDQTSEAARINQIPDNIGLALSFLDTPPASIPTNIRTISSRDNDSLCDLSSDNNDSDSDDSEFDQYHTQNREHEYEVYGEEPLLFPLEIECGEKCSAVFKGYEGDDDYVRVTSPSPTGDSNESIETIYTYEKFLEDFKPQVAKPSGDEKENIQPLLTLGLFQDHNPRMSDTLYKDHLSLNEKNNKSRKG
jgi:hypothetical protein